MGRSGGGSGRGRSQGWDGGRGGAAGVGWGEARGGKREAHGSRGPASLGAQWRREGNKKSRGPGGCSPAARRPWRTDRTPGQGTGGHMERKGPRGDDAARRGPGRGRRRLYLRARPARGTGCLRRDCSSSGAPRPSAARLRRCDLRRKHPPPPRCVCARSGPTAHALRPALKGATEARGSPGAPRPPAGNRAGGRSAGPGRRGRPQARVVPPRRAPPGAAARAACGRAAPPSPAPGQTRRAAGPRPTRGWSGRVSAEWGNVRRLSGGACLTGDPRPSAAHLHGDLCPRHGGSGAEA